MLVSSGAIAAGLAPLGLRARPRDLATQQAAASVGQGLLVHRYTEAFARHGCTVGQVLLTADDVVRRAHYRNAQRTLDRLLALGAVPVVNENDTVATDEIRFGDNDRLAALVAHLVARRPARAALRRRRALRRRPAPAGRPPARRGPRRRPTSPASTWSAGPGRSGVGTGGMATKVEAARIATVGRDPGRAHLGRRTPAPRWPATTSARYFHPTGARRGDPAAVAGARDHAARPAAPRRRAPCARSSSAGCRCCRPASPAVDGDFEAGDPVDLLDESGHAVARGLVNFDAAELPALLGRSTRDLARELGPAYEREVVHRDDLVLLSG